MRFAKLHGAGNDFLLFDGREQPGLEPRLAPLVPRLCHRRLGVGADGVLLLQPRGDGVAQVVYWNSDGSRGAFCANGTRCAARFAAERWGWKRPVLETDFAAIPAAVDGATVTLDLPAPESMGPWRELSVGETAVRGRYLVVGVPHLVVPVEWGDFRTRPLVPLAPTLRAHDDLPAGGANVHFVRRPASGCLEIRSYERGVEGETLACGSGVVAAALVALAERWATSPVTLRTASGRTLEVVALGEPPACASRLTGPAEWVADGVLAAELLAPSPDSPSAPDRAALRGGGRPRGPHGDH